MAATLFLLSLGCSARYVARICSRFMEAISLLPKSQPMPIFPLSSQSSAYTPPCLARIIQALIAAPPFCHWFHLIACSEMQLQAPDVHVLIVRGPHRILAPCAWTSDGAWPSMGFRLATCLNAGRIVPGDLERHAVFTNRLA